MKYLSHTCTVNEFSNNVNQFKVNAASKYILFYIYAQMKSRGLDEIDISTDQLSKAINKHQRTVNRYIAELRNVNAIEVFRNYKKSGERTSNKYKLLMFVL